MMVALVMVSAAMVLIMMDGCNLGGSYGGGSNSNDGMAILEVMVGRVC